MRCLSASAIAFLLCATVSASGPLFDIFPIGGGEIPAITQPARPCNHGLCSPGLECNDQNVCVNAKSGSSAVANLSVVEKLALRKVLDDALSTAQLGSSCQKDSECLPGTCCSANGLCSIRETSQCGGPQKQKQATIAVQARLGSFCDLNTGCQSGCCSRVYGICMVGENQQCLPSGSSPVKDEL